jgi:hypothetical protein
MTMLHIHPHAAFDQFPQLLASLAEEHGTDGLSFIAEQFAAAEAADLHWDSRFAERNLGAYEGFDDDDDGAELVRIIGYFRSRYFVATCVVNSDRRVRSLLKLTRFDDVQAAEIAFRAGGG